MDQPDFIPQATILVVDDTPDNLVLMSRLLKDEYRVKVANSGERALKIAKAEVAPDLILLDIMMPEMDGYEVCQRLKADPRTMHIPVIFLTAKAEVEDEKKGLELGAVDYITKPISPPIVLARVKNHLALKRLSDFLLAKNIELKHATAMADKANLAKSDFLSSMSHELRSPLNAILGFAQLLETDTPPPSAGQQESVTHILKAGWHLLKLINEILDLAKVESRQVSLSLEPVSLAEVILECQNMIDLQAQQRGVKLLFPQTDIPFFVLADRTRVKQILLNLLSNSVKYNVPHGTVHVTCAEGQEGRIRVSVQDTGEGLNPDQISQLFQSFNRLGQETGREPGTGIGLVMAKQLIELMGGNIGVESAVGVGSTFWFELVSVAEPRLTMSLNDPVALVHLQMLRRAQIRTLLYVEDNPANLSLVEQIMARFPEIRLLTATDGIRGVEVARAAHPDIILMDINLPGINGYEALEILRLDPATAHIPIIALSADAMPRDIERGLEAGFNRYLTKPVKVSELMDTLHAYDPEGTP